MAIRFVFYLFPPNCLPCIVVAAGNKRSENNLSWVWILTSSVYFFNTISTFSSGELSLFRLCNKDVASLPARKAFSIHISEWRDKEDDRRPQGSVLTCKLQNKSTAGAVKSQSDSAYYNKIVGRANKTFAWINLHIWALLL